MASGVKNREGHPVMRTPRVADFFRAPDGSVRDKAQVKALYEKSLLLWGNACDAETMDPIRKGWEPPIWKVCDALLGLPLFDTAFETQIRERFGWTWEEWCEAMRLRLYGSTRRLRVLLISGPNRSGKTEYAAKRTNQILSLYPNEIAWCYAQNNDNSIEIMQPALYRYLPAEMRQVDIKSKTAYIKYSKHNGFTDNRYILHNGSLASLRNYSQKEETLEGPALKWVWADELIPPNFQKTLEGRIGDRDGWMVDTFTPIKGWSATVGMFMQESEIVKACTAFLLPLDKGDPDTVRGFGFESAEERDAAWSDCPKRTVPEDVHCWIEGDGFADCRLPSDDWMRDVLPLPAKRSQPAVPAGRHFETAPRVVKCYEDHKGVVFFQPMDNPFGNPPSVWDLWKKSATKTIKERLYGWATKTFAGQFPKFDDKHHCFDIDQLPETGSNYQMTDPTPGGRPFVSLHGRVVGDSLWIYREWPQVYRDDKAPSDVPFGKWAVPSGRKNGVNDGDPSDGAEPIGWGVRAYVKEWARLEGWDFEEALAVYDSEREDDEGWREDPMAKHIHKVALMEQGRGGESQFGAAPGSEDGECVVERGLDSRAASSPRIENDRSTTLFEMFRDYGLDMCLAPGIGIEERVAMVNSLLDYEENKDGETIVAPRLFICRDCLNLIFALHNWTGADGLSGATKDFVDALCYMVAKFVAGEWYDLNEEGGAW